MFDELRPLLSAFRKLPDFRRESLALSFDSSVGTANKITCGVQFGPVGTLVHVQLHGAPAAPWVRRRVRALLHAGYEEKWRMPDEVAVDRWIPRQAELAGELQILTRAATTKRLPERSPTERVARRRSRNSREWAKVDAVIRGAKLPWDHAALVFSRGGTLDGQPDRAASVRALQIVFEPGRRRYYVHVDIFGGAVDLPAAVERRIRALPFGQGFALAAKDGLQVDTAQAAATVAVGLYQAITNHR